MIVTVEHVRKARELHGGYCTKGMRVWFERHGLDIRVFIREGYPLETIAAINDAFSQRVVEIALKEARP